MRVGERTDFDRLYLDIKTDGTITSEEAFFQASDILVKHFSLFAEPFKALKILKEKPASAKASSGKKVSVKKKSKKTSQ